MRMLRYSNRRSDETTHDGVTGQCMDSMFQAAPHGNITELLPVQIHLQERVQATRQLEPREVLGLHPRVVVVQVGQCLGRAATTLRQRWCWALSGAWPHTNIPCAQTSQSALPGCSPHDPEQPSARRPCCGWHPTRRRLDRTPGRSGTVACDAVTPSCPQSRQVARPPRPLL